MDPLSQSWHLFLDWFENISLLVVLIFLYNYIPDRFFIHRDRIYSVFVGLIFTFAAIMGIFIPWGGTSHPSIGINGVLVPLAGLVGGPISAAIITVTLVLSRLPLNFVGIDLSDTLIIIIAGIIGALFYLARERKILRLAPITELIILSSLFACITGIVLICNPVHDQNVPPGAQILSVPVIEVAVIIFFGLILLGSVIRAIDRKRDGEYELVAYKEHLEALVQERTAALERTNSLQEATIESTTDGIIVTGLHGEVTGYNSAGASVLGIVDKKCESNQIPDIYSLVCSQVHKPDNLLQCQEKLADYPHEPVKVDLKFQNGSTYELSVTPHRLAGVIIGHVYNFRNITKRKMAEEAIKTVNQKLLLLSGITRHDILNQLTALNLYVQLVIDETTDTGIKEHLYQIDQILKTMQLHTEFTSDYQDVGLHEPVWQIPGDIFIQASAAFKDKGIEFKTGKMEYEIYTDPLLERVFYNLIDNSLRHGEHVSSISLTEYMNGHKLILVYHDNGTGILPAEKEKIFQKGFGKHTGFGMFLIHDILSITGISIREKGIYGEGVRFEITVPPDKFRPKTESAT